jgi:hypothetical protein
MTNQNDKLDPVLAYAMHLKAMQVMFTTRMTVTERIRMRDEKKELYIAMREYLSTFAGKAEPYKYLYEELERQRIKWNLDSIDPAPAAPPVQAYHAAKAKVRAA